ncbi:MAG: hypothetical protein M3Z92_07725 [Bacteroidota bacterium]|nr:hypothetical protein [Bacteroidota bacterium]
MPCNFLFLWSMGTLANTGRKILNLVYNAKQKMHGKKIIVSSSIDEEWPGNDPLNDHHL